MVSVCGLGDCLIYVAGWVFSCGGGLGFVLEVFVLWASAPWRFGDGYS